jgi:hypothetical protein
LLHLPTRTRSFMVARCRVVAGLGALPASVSVRRVGLRAYLVFLVCARPWLVTHRPAPGSEVGAPGCPRGAGVSWRQRVPGLGSLRGLLRAAPPRAQLLLSRIFSAVPPRGLASGARVLAYPGIDQLARAEQPVPERASPGEEDEGLPVVGFPGRCSCRGRLHDDDVPRRVLPRRRLLPRLLPGNLSRAGEAWLGLRSRRGSPHGVEASSRPSSSRRAGWSSTSKTTGSSILGVLALT